MGKNKAGISYVAYLAAMDWKKDKNKDDLKEWTANYLTTYTKGAITNHATYIKFYELVIKEL